MPIECERIKPVSLVEDCCAQPVRLLCGESIESDEYTARLTTTMLMMSMSVNAHLSETVALWLILGLRSATLFFESIAHTVSYRVERQITVLLWARWLVVVHMFTLSRQYVWPCARERRAPSET